MLKMATQSRVKIRSGNSLTRLADKMAARNQEIRPVGAWAQPSTYLCIDAAESASREEARLQELQAQKTARLLNFQEEVRQRVQAMNKFKRQQQLDISFKAVLSEQNIISQSSNASEKSSLKRNCCTVRPESDLAIRQGKIGGVADSHPEQFLEQMKQVHELNNRARKSLATKQILSENFEHDDLPGGIWHTGPTLDHPVSRNILEDHCGHVVMVEDSVAKDFDDLGTASKPVVKFDIEPSKEPSRLQRISRKSASTISGTEVDRVPHAPNIYPGVQDVEERTRSQQQRASYRRLFMDIEREQVKENLRQKDHRKKMAVLKKAKEMERLRVEQLTLQGSEPVDPRTGQTQEESEAIDMMQKEVSQLSLDEVEKWKQKNREVERFLNALKRNLKEKMEKANIELLQLCSCGTSLWDTSPETCANNCAFYRNPKGYARALQSLLASCEAV